MTLNYKPSLEGVKDVLWIYVRELTVNQHHRNTGPHFMKL